MQDKIKIRYLNLSASPKSYEIRIYGREFIKKDLGQDIYENIESQIVYGEKEGEIENLDLDKVEQYLKFHAKPWETVSLDVQGTPSIMVGDLVQFVSEYNVLGRGQITKNVFKIEKGNIMSSTLTTLKLPTNEINPLGDFSMGVVGDMSLGG